MELKIKFLIFNLLILLTFPFFSSGQLRTNTIALGYGVHRYFDWEAGSTGFEIQVTRKLSQVFRASFDLSHVVRDLTTDPKIDLNEYINKMAERRLTYLDLTLGACFIKNNRNQMQGIFFLGPSFELGSEYLLYGIIDGSFSELNGASFIRHEIGFASALEFVFIVKKRMDIRPRIEFRDYTTGSPCVSGFLIIGYEFNHP